MLRPPSSSVNGFSHVIKTRSLRSHHPIPPTRPITHHRLASHTTHPKTRPPPPSNPQHKPKPFTPHLTHKKPPPPPHRPPNLGSRILNTRHLTLTLLLTSLATAVYFFPLDTAAGKRLNTKTFTPCQIVRVEKVTETLSLHTLTLPGGADTGGEPRPRENSEVVGIRSLQIAHPRLSVQRSYTPLPSSSPGELRILVRHLPNGSVSPYLHQLQQGEEMMVRGPYMEYTFPPLEEVEEVVCLVGGTGVAVGMQVVDALLNGPGEVGRPRVRVLYAVRDGRECVGLPLSPALQLPPPPPPGGRTGRQWFWASKPTPAHDPPLSPSQPPPRIPPHLASLTNNPEKLLITAHIDNTPSTLSPAHISSVLKHPPSDSKKRRILLVSGPDGFVSHWVGPKVWEGGREGQGVVGGVVGGILEGEKGGGWEVWKL